MSSLLTQLGIDWRLLASQAVNFLILLAVLRYFVYKPLLKMMAHRRSIIEGGIAKAAEADKRLGEISNLQREKLKEAEAQGVEIVKTAESAARERERKILAEAQGKGSQILEAAAEKSKSDEQAARAKVEAEAAELVKKILVETVSLSPDAVDEALIRKVARSHTKARA